MAFRPDLLVELRNLSKLSLNSVRMAIYNVVALDRGTNLIFSKQDGISM
jgi:hypothetical protein